jgi:hypothetical protein
MGILADLQAEVLERLEAQRTDPNVRLPVVTSVMNPQLLAARTAPPPVAKPATPAQEAAERARSDREEWASIREETATILAKLESIAGPPRAAPTPLPTQQAADARRELLNRAVAGQREQADAKARARAAKVLRKAGLL